MKLLRYADYVDYSVPLVWNFALARPGNHENTIHRPRALHGQDMDC